MRLALITKFRTAAGLSPLSRLSILLSCSIFFFPQSTCHLLTSYRIDFTVAVADTDLSLRAPRGEGSLGGSMLPSKHLVGIQKMFIDCINGYLKNV